MPRVVPSQIVELIDTFFPQVKNEAEGTPLQLKFDHATQLLSIVELVGQIPSELITLKADQYAEYVSSISAINWMIRRWQQVDRPARETMPLLITGLRKHSSVALIRQALTVCPDEFPLITIAELAFITDSALRESLRLDISATNSALSNGEWKAATVLAGSVIEALLLWVLEAQPPAKLQNSIASLLASNALSTKPHSNLEKWGLHEYLEVAADLKLIKEDTAIQTRLAKNYRNLIHPGRAQRLGQVCNRATALAAVSAMERVREDLTP